LTVKRLFLGAALALWLGMGSFCSTACAEIIFANNATFGPIYLQEIDLNLKTGKGTTVLTINPPEGASLNGRGAVVVNNIFYWTTASNNNVYAYDLTNNKTLGKQFSVAGAGALSTIAYDGTNFWISDYTGSNKAFLYTPTGTLLNTITLKNAGAFYDGLEYAILGGQTRLIANRGDATGPYDLYDTSGNLITSKFIDTSKGSSGGASTGIAYDGTNFFTSTIFGNKIDEWDSSGNFIQTIALDVSAPQNHLIEDLSFDYTNVLPPPNPSPVPEPASLTLLGFGVTGLIVYGKRRRRSAVA
jgi:hypothetical protein